MKTPSIRLMASGVAALMLLAACGGTTGTTWTFAPALPTPTVGPSVMPSMGASSAPTTAPSAGTSAAPASPGGSVVPGSPAASVAASPGPAHVIKLELTGSLSITQDGQTVTALDVKEGETVHFVIDNTAGFTHNFHIATADQLQQNAPDLPGIPDWTSGVQEFDYMVTADTAGLEFACTVPGHYSLMHGTFNVTP
jgi:uncharacterized cupredoxin-like copper-binding protein